MQLELDAEERDLLAHLVDGAIKDLRVEVRRTRTPDFHDRLVREEERLKEVLDRLKALS